MRMDGLSDAYSGNLPEQPSRGQCKKLMATISGNKKGGPEAAFP
ncbi:hypothetical protein [Bosea sp. CRIB-10]|nr:hypothetical protein [Bosea sp. CRIB-10]